MASVLQDRQSSPLGKPRRLPEQSPAPWFDDDHQPMAYFAPHRSTADYTGAARRSPMVMHGARDLTGFSTPQRVTFMGREHDLVQFRTPQHPLGGTNNWGGASPLLSRNIPKESLEINYLKFNPLTDLGTVLGTPMQEEIDEKGGDVKRRKRDWVLRKFGWKKKEEKKVLGSGGEMKKRSWLSKRWPQGW